MRDIKIYKVIKSSIADTVEKGQVVLDEVTCGLSLKDKVILDFGNIERVTHEFAYTALGMLLCSFSYKEIKENLEIINIDDLSALTCAAALTEATKDFLMTGGN
ncbi:STAS-like domain-containing protein [Clostridium tertium]|uniref:STAS-like domain-containing protein n=1 Tax=Clostridium tertium TaxID=1559 RepID=UPI0023B27A3F|nr:STAS-like domain-containing protein [Clostridium tertium]